MKKKKKWVIGLTVAVAVICLPILFNFLFLLPSIIPVKWLIGNPEYWLTYWPVYIGSIGTFAMAVTTFMTLLQNKELIKAQNTPKLSCSLAVGNSCLLVVITNISSVTAHDVRISLTNKTSIKEIYNFDSLCCSLEKVRFDISPNDSKKIRIYGIEPHSTGKYDGYISVILNYNGVTETTNIYLEELTITEWKRN